jgi:hypothetical protein
VSFAAQGSTGRDFSPWEKFSWADPEVLDLRYRPLHMQQVDFLPFTKRSRAYELEPAELLELLSCPGPDRTTGMCRA